MFVNRTIFITGASRGIGAAIAKRLSIEGANLVLTAKTVVKPHDKLDGTVMSVIEEIENSGTLHNKTKFLPLELDIRKDEQIKSVVSQAANKFGGIDILINNASALNNRGSVEITSKQFDLIHDINSRGTFKITNQVLPYLLKSTYSKPHILNLSPPINLDPKWFGIGGTAYTVSKYNMSMWALGWSEEYRGKIAVNTLWPRTVVKTAAIQGSLGEFGMRYSRSPEIMAEAAVNILKREKDCTGNFFIDDEVLVEDGWSRKDIRRFNYGLFQLPDLYVGSPGLIMHMLQKWFK